MNTTDSPNYDAACILFPNLPATWFVDADPADMYYSLSIGVKLGITKNQDKLFSRLLYDKDFGKLKTMYTEEVTDVQRKKEAEAYYNFEPAIKDWQRTLLSLNPFFKSCKTLVKEGAMKMCAYKMVESIVGSFPSKPFDDKCAEALKIMASVSGIESSSFKGAKRHLERYTNRLDEGLREMGGFGGTIEIKTYSDKTLQKKKEELQKEFFREGKTKEEWLEVKKTAFHLWTLFPEGNDKEFMQVIHDSAYVEYQKFLPEKERGKASLMSEIMKGKARD